MPFHSATGIAMSGSASATPSAEPLGLCLPSVPRRRNGRQQACEPCRKRKVACDHRVPVCTRCRRGKVAEKCEYVVVNTNKRRIQGASSPLALSPPRPRVNGNSPQQLGSTTPAAPSESTPRSDGNAGYLGATSAYVVFEEAQSSLVSVPGGVPGATPRGNHSIGAVKPLPTMSDKTSEMALGILRSIPQKAFSVRFFKRHVNPNDGWCRLAAEKVLDSLWATFDDALRDRDDQDALLKVAQKLCYNSSHILNENIEDSRAWLGSFSGPNLRWEALGILFTYWSFGMNSLPQSVIDTDYKHILGCDPQALVLLYKESAWKCAELCREVCKGNTLLVYLLYKHSLLESIISGDASVEYWRLHSDVISLTTFLGLHVSPRGSSSQWTIPSEIKRRLFAAVYNIDKTAATFTGRPPGITHTFCSTPLPLDISDEQLLQLGQPKTSRSNIPVDENGWNTESKIYSTTILRARVMMAWIKDAVLGMILQGHDITDQDRELLYTLKTQELEAIAQFPSSILFHEGDVRSPTVDAQTLYVKLLVRLEHLQTLFFIERLLSQASSPANPQLLQVSLEMVSLTLVFWTHQNRLAGLEGDYEWLVMSYAAPAGGVICLELLKPSGLCGGSEATALTRSEMVQKMSLLVGFLDWVGPSAPNGDLCEFVKRVARRVLDEALNVRVSEGDLGAVERLGGEVADWGMEFGGDTNEFFSFDLLDTFDWLRAE